MMRRRYIALIFVLIFLSCKKDKPLETEPEKPVQITQKGGVFIINEGNFQWGNASIDFYNNVDSSYSSNIFKTANNRPLGDVFQSMEIIKDKAYLVINNSGKIEVVNLLDFKTIGTISGLTSPRYFQSISPTKAYVTDYADNAISVVDLNTNSVVKKIPCMGFTEEIILSNGKVFVTNIQSEYVYVVNPLTDLITDSIKTGFASNSIRQDKNGKLWVLCNGSSTNNKPGSLHRIDPNTNLVEYSVFYQDANQNPFKLRINSSNDILYFLNKGVCKIDINNPSLPAEPFIKQVNSIFYGLGVEPETGKIYVADAIDYVQRGKVMRYNNQGVLIDSFLAGIIPGDFYFLEE
ncbi:MAG: YncE family protein [Bacteroidota bacterium]|nr:YncE family protein [Bacteroidota bacterium]